MDALNYLLIKNPISSTVIHASSSALSYCGITPKKTASSSSVIMAEVLRPFQSLGSTRHYIRIAGVSGSAATILGAMGSHWRFNPENEAELKRIFETANRFHFFSTLALIGIPFTRKPHLSGPLMVIGTTLFCGPMYYRALTNDSKNKLNRVVPFGGFLLITAWLTMVL